MRKQGRIVVDPMVVKNDHITVLPTSTQPDLANLQRAQDEQSYLDLQIPHL